MIYSDEEWESILESRGALDESVGAMPDWEWDILACDCEDVLTVTQVPELRRAA